MSGFDSPTLYLVIAGLDPEFRRQLVVAVTDTGGIVVAEASSSADIVGLITRWEASAVVVDVRLGLTGVLTALYKIKAQSTVHLVVIADDINYRGQLLAAGADEVISKDNECVSRVTATLMKTYS